MRIRTLKPEFWGHPILSRLDDSTRLLAIGLLNVADDEGYFLAAPALIRSDIWPFEEDSTRARRTLDELTRAGFVEVCTHETHGPIGLVVNFRKHQRVDRPTPSKLKSYFDSSNARRTFDESSTNVLVRNREGNREQGREVIQRASAPAREVQPETSSPLPTAEPQDPPLNPELVSPAPTQAPAAPRSKTRKPKPTTAELTLEVTESVAPLPFPSPEFAAAWKDWLQHRSESRRPLRATATRAQLAQLATIGEVRSIASIRHSLASGYMGIYEPKTTQTNGNADLRRHFSGKNDYSSVQF